MLLVSITLRGLIVEKDREEVGFLDLNKEDDDDELQMRDNDGVTGVATD